MTLVRLLLLGDCVITVSDAVVDPSSTHLFALLLIFSLERERRVHRSELQRLLFAAPVEAQQASHNLRQLLYRVRRLGLTLDETATGIRLPAQDVVSYDDQLRALMAGDCEAVTEASLAFLPSYYPRLPRTYGDWLDRQRDIASQAIRGSLANTLARLRDGHSWLAVHRVGTALAALDPANDDAVAAIAEALTMLGRRPEALAVIASFAASDATAGSANDKFRPLRARIARIGPTRSESPLRGRTESLAYLDGEWAKVAREGARRAALVGNAGIGKTRVAEAFATRIALLGAHVTRYTCDAASSQHPLGAFSDLLPELRSLRGSLGVSPQFTDALDRLRPREGVAIPHTSSDVSVEAIRTQVQSAIIDLVEAVSHERPLLLLIDDAHYLDSASVNVITALSRTQTSAKVLVLLCLRRSHVQSPLLASTRRGTIRVLEPMSPELSRQIVLDAAGADCTETHIAWCIAQAVGNPFYLHTLGAQRFVPSPTIPFDIRSLASCAYSSLSDRSRNVLEACLLLGRFASLQRVHVLADMAHRALLAALRELEALDLIQFEAGLLTVPHALLHDALRSCIPSSIAALMHSRIGTLLEQECESEGYAFPIAWAAAQSHLAAGDPNSAATLIRACARHAALVGEPAVARDLLSHVVDTKLPLRLHAELLDDLMDYGEAADMPTVLLSASRMRHSLAIALADRPDTVKHFELGIIDADFRNGVPVSAVLGPYYRLLEDVSASSLTRACAAMRIMTLADRELDADLAERALSSLHCLEALSLEAVVMVRRAELVFHTFCGDATTAVTLAYELLDRFPRPTSKLASISARHFASFALLRLRDYEMAVRTCTESYRSLLALGIQNHALYAAVSLCLIALAEGDFPTARLWVRNARAAVGGGVAHEVSPNAGLNSCEAIIAMQEGRYDDAESQIFAPGRDSSLLSSNRYKAICLAMSVRLQQLKGEGPGDRQELAELGALYARGCGLGGQDLVAEALWAARGLTGDTNGATALLRQYLASRRERGQPEWSLRNTTRDDKAWLIFS